VSGSLDFHRGLLYCFVGASFFGRDESLWLTASLLLKHPMLGAAAAAAAATVADSDAAADAAALHLQLKQVQMIIRCICEIKLLVAGHTRLRSTLATQTQRVG
jgi:hypothetical protein